MNINEDNHGRALLIKGKTGLGNRILSALTGCALADYLGRTPYIDWRDGLYIPKGENLYPLLFEDKYHNDPRELDHCLDVAPPIWIGRISQHPIDLVNEFFPTQHSSLTLYRKLSIPLNGKDVDSEVAVFWSYVSKMRKVRQHFDGNRRARLQQSNQMERRFINEFFTPIEKISKLADDFISSMNKPIVGIHIRYTDVKSPLESTLRKIAHVQKKIDNPSFFLSTDSLEVEEIVKKNFKDVRTISKYYDAQGFPLHERPTLVTKNPLAEAQNALLDMIILSRCEKIIFSSRSTFAQVACIIGQHKGEDRIDIDRYNPVVAFKKFIQSLI